MSSFEEMVEREAARRKAQAENRTNGNGTVSDVLPPPGKPMNVARIFVAQCCAENAILTLRHWRGGWWQWRQSHWRELEDGAVRGLLYAFTENAVYLVGKGKGEPWAPTRRKIGDLLEALGAICSLPDDFQQPCRLDGTSIGTIVAVANGLLDVA